MDPDEDEETLIECISCEAEFVIRGLNSIAWDGEGPEFCPYCGAELFEFEMYNADAEDSE